MRLSTEFIVVHCSATRADPNIDVETIRKWHKDKGWSDVGYAFVIKTNGDIQLGRGIDEIGAHVQGYNSRSIGICLVGGLDANGKPSITFSHNQLLSLRLLIDGLLVRYPNADVLGHRDFSPDKDGDGKIERHEWFKACPCFDVNQWYCFDRLVEDAYG